MGGPRRYGMKNGGKMTKQRTTPTAKRNHGFTLMEMLIVVAIIAVLVAVAIPTFSSQLHKARVATDWANVRSYYAQLQYEFMETGEINDTYLSRWDGTINSAFTSFKLNGQEIKLKAGIEAANKQCPIDMGETGKITSIVYDGENVVYTFYLNEEAANIKTLQKNPESMKTSLKIMFQNPNKEVKSLLDLVVKCKAGLQMIYIGKDSGEQVVCELTTDEIKEILNKDVDTTESDLAKLETQVQMANLQFPIQASEDVLIEKIELSDEAVIYICRVDEDLCDMNQIKANAAEVKQGIIETLGNQTDLATQLFIKSCVNCDRNIVYRYIGKQSEAQHDVVITVPELKDMLKKE